MVSPVKQALLLFTRVPVAGRTKTRLYPALTPSQCAQAHRAFLQDIVLACTLPRQWDLLVFYGQEGPLSILRQLLPEQRAFFPQQGNTLGQRMDRAVRQALEMGYASCVLIGADVPQVHRGVIARAMSLLAECDLVLGPTQDGGYYLLGTRQPCTAVFSGQRYGGSTVFADTVEAARRAGLRWTQAPSLRDVDEPEDLRALARYLAHTEENLCPNSRAFLQELGWMPR